MQHFRSLAEVKISNAWLTIGVFDGIHRGHQTILKRLTADARRNSAPAVLLSFHPHPANVLGGRDLRLLTTPSERADLAATLGVDAVIILPFDRSVAETSAREFMSQLKERLGLRRLLIGYDFALGKNREGNAQRLAELGLEMGYTLEIVPSVSDESGVISSTAIRKLISAGNVTEAAKLLGRNYSICGPVIHGDGRGRRIGVPTANLGYPASKILPPNGIYACWARIGAERFMAATNIGVNPTFTPDKRAVNVEAHLLDFDRDIYDRMMTVEFVSRLRDELKYESVEALVNQIHKDVEETRKVLS